MAARKQSSRSRKSAGLVKALRARVRELEETLEAIRSGQVDALVISSGSVDQIFTLQSAESPYRVLVESINEGAATMDSDGTILYANDRFAQILDVPLEKLIGTGMQNHVSPTEWYKLHVVFEQGRQYPTSSEISFEDRKSRRRIVRFSLSPFPESGRQMICAVITDVTAMIEANELQKKSEEELQALSGRLLQLQDDQKRQISRDLHDVTGQKLAALNLDLSQLEKTKAVKSDPAALRFLAECRELSGQISEEIRTLSYLLHPPLLDEVGLSSAVRWFVDGFARRTGIQVSVDVTPELNRLPHDVEIALFRVVQEGLTNVHRYSGSPTAQVRLETHENQVKLKIQDQGKGISKSFIESGTLALLGVGIQGMRERMRQLAGKLEISSGPQGGTTVVATLPMEISETSTDFGGTEYVSEEQNPAPDETSQATLGQVKRILIADDHEMLRVGIRRAFENRKDWIVLGEATNGKEAVEKTLALKPDLVILDINMPVLNGLAALRKIRQLSPSTRVLMFSVNNSDQTIREAMAAGADGFLCKSNASNDLIQAMNDIFEKHRVPAMSAVKD